MSRALLLLCLSVAVVACDDGPTDTTDTTDSTDSTDSTDDTDTTGGDIAAGETVFGNTCAGCHGPNGNDGGSGPNLDERVPNLNVDQVKQTVTDGKGYMPPQDLTETEIIDVAAYVIDKHGG